MRGFFCWLLGHRWTGDTSTLRQGAVRYCERCNVGSIRMFFNGDTYCWFRIDHE